MAYTNYLDDLRTSISKASSFGQDVGMFAFTGLMCSNLASEEDTHIRFWLVSIIQGKATVA
ncbi:hypothetical protein BYT27DRAFT_7204419 [Phlegmacium glaucopus]|nr:hypothetical protein BYT27DRAFT_7204419 [Phlegmacium glaucopus]